MTGCLLFLPVLVPLNNDHQMSAAAGAMSRLQYKTGKLQTQLLFLDVVHVSLLSHFQAASFLSLVVAR